MDFSVLAKTFENLESTTKRLEMTDILAKLFKRAKADEIDRIIYLLQGRVGPSFEPIEIGMGESFVEQAISKSTGHTQKQVKQKYRSLGDLGLVAEEFIHKKAQRSLVSKKLNIEYVYNNFYKIAIVSGAGSQSKKIKLLTELLNNAKPLEAKYIVRVPLNQLRLGIGDPTILDALSVKQKGDKSLRDRLERGYNVTSDLGLVAKTLYRKGISAVDHIEMKVNQPLLPALAERLPSAEEIIKKIGKCAVELKYDGFRLQVHKRGDSIKIFSRRLENMTHMFPEVVRAIKKQVKGKDVIFEGEALSYNEHSKEFRPFQQTMQRKRKYDIGKMAEQFPLKLFAFEILYSGKNLATLPYKQRRKMLEKTIKVKDVHDTIQLAEQIITDDAAELTKYFDDSISRGLEGIIAKDLNAPYTTGARKFAWIKLKRSYKGELSDTVDVVIVGYYKGRGMRTKFGFGGFLGAVYDKKEDRFKTIARVGSGFKEAQMKELRQKLDKIKLKDRSKKLDSLVKADVWVEPKYVVEVNADEITESPMHTAGRRKEIGYALRFPRMVRYREKKATDATTVSEIEKMYKMQARTKLEQ